MRDGVRDKTDDGIQQIKYPSCKEFKKKHDALGEKTVVSVFAKLPHQVSETKSYRKLYNRFLLCKSKACYRAARKKVSRTRLRTFLGRRPISSVGYGNTFRAMHG